MKDAFTFDFYFPATSKELEIQSFISKQKVILFCKVFPTRRFGKYLNQDKQESFNKK